MCKLNTMSDCSNVRRGFLFLFALGAWAADLPAQTITDLGLLPGGSYLLPSNVSVDGSVVVGEGDSAGGTARAWRWTAATGKADLGTAAGASYASAYFVSGNGQCVVGISGSSYDVAMRWTQATGMQSLGALAVGQPSFAFGASYDGAVVVGDGYYANGTQRAFRWTSATGMQPLTQLLPGTSHSVALAISSDGSTIAGYCYNNAPSLVPPTACLWDASFNIASLGTLPGVHMSVPSAINIDGSIVVGYSANLDGTSGRAFRWTPAGGMEDLGLPPGGSSASAAGLTDDGDIIVGQSSSGGDSRATIWTPAGGGQYLSDYLQLQGVDLTGWVLRTADISADGSALCGWGIHDGNYASWYLELACSTAPTILTEPLSQTVAPGTPVTFSVQASGIRMQYQWYKNNAVLPGATAPVFNIASAQSADAGSYHCVVTNDCGSNTSLAATLTVSAGGGGCDADLNEDGMIDLLDLALLLVSYGDTGGVPFDDGDLDGDGDVDLLDLSALLTVFGTTCP